MAVSTVDHTHRNGEEFSTRDSAHDTVTQRQGWGAASSPGGPINTAPIGPFQTTVLQSPIFSCSSLIDSCKPNRCRAVRHTRHTVIKPLQHMLGGPSPTDNTLLYSWARRSATLFTACAWCHHGLWRRRTGPTSSPIMPAGISSPVEFVTGPL